MFPQQQQAGGGGGGNAGGMGAGTGLGGPSAGLGGGASGLGGGLVGDDFQQQGGGAGTGTVAGGMGAYMTHHQQQFPGGAAVAAAAAGLPPPAATGGFQGGMVGVGPNTNPTAAQAAMGGRSNQKRRGGGNSADTGIGLGVGLGGGNNETGGGGRAAAAGGDLAVLLQSVLEEIRDVVDFAENRRSYFIFVNDPHADFVRQTLGAIAQRLSTTKEDIEEATRLVANKNNNSSNNNMGGGLWMNNNNMMMNMMNNAGAGGVAMNHNIFGNMVTAEMANPAAVPPQDNTGEARALTKANRKRKSTTDGAVHRRSAAAAAKRKKKEEEYVLPEVPSPADGKQYTKQEAVDILLKMNKKDRNRTTSKWIYEKKIPIESNIQMNKICLFAREGRPMNMEWRTSEAMKEGEEIMMDILPPPKNGDQYTKREVIDILVHTEPKLTTKEKNKIINSWIADKKIPVLYQGTVHRVIKAYEEDPDKPIREGWGRWGKGNEKFEEVDKKSGKKKSSPLTFPPPNNGKEYTKLEAINILSKMENDTRNRTKTIHAWIERKLIPVTHPNTMVRLLREAKSNKPMKSINWRTDETIPYAPPPRNQVTQQYDKQEIIEILSQLRPRDRSRLTNLWINEGKIQYKSQATVGNLIRKALKEKKAANPSLNDEAVEAAAKTAKSEGGTEADDAAKAASTETAATVKGEGSDKGGADVEIGGDKDKDAEEEGTSDKDGDKKVAGTEKQKKDNDKTTSQKNSPRRSTRGKTKKDDGDESSTTTSEDGKGNRVTI